MHRCMSSPVLLQPVLVELVQTGFYIMVWWFPTWRSGQPPTGHTTQPVVLLMEQDNIMAGNVTITIIDMNSNLFFVTLGVTVCHRWMQHSILEPHWCNSGGREVQSPGPSHQNLTLHPNVRDTAIKCYLQDSVLLTGKCCNFSYVFMQKKKTCWLHTGSCGARTQVFYFKLVWKMTIRAYVHTSYKSISSLFQEKNNTKSVLLHRYSFLFWYLLVQVFPFFV